MAAGKCKAAYNTDEWHGYGCEITGDACMFLYPDSKVCAEKYGEGPDAEKEFEDDMTKYECLYCGKQFIIGDAAADELQPGFPVCPYCGQSNAEWISKREAGGIEDMGCMAIVTKGVKHEKKNSDT